MNHVEEKTINMVFFLSFNKIVINIFLEVNKEISISNYFVIVRHEEIFEI